MLKAGALIYAVVLAFIFVLLSSSIILVNYHTSFTQEHFFEEERLILNAKSGINLLLADWQSLEDNKSANIDLFGYERDSVLLKTRQWGLFRLMAAKSHNNKSSYQKVCLAASVPDTNLAIYLSNTDKVLYVCGNTFINGNCALPAASIKRAYIEGQTFQGKKKANGIITESTRELPAINTHIVSKNLELLTNPLFIEDSILTLENIRGKTLKNSFLNKTLVIISEASMNLSEMSFSGNIIIWSSKKITIEKSVFLEDVLICAPIISIAEGFKGRINGLASDSITLQENVELTYPSSLAVMRKSSENKKNAEIQIQEDCIVEGPVLVYEQQVDFRTPSYIKLAQNSKVVGQIYTNGSFENKGKVAGNVYCNRFYLKTSSSSYENHLLNAEIDIKSLPISYVGLGIKAESELEYNIAKWVF